MIDTNGVGIGLIASLIERGGGGGSRTEWLVDSLFDWLVDWMILSLDDHFIDE